MVSHKNGMLEIGGQIHVFQRDRNFEDPETIFCDKYLLTTKAIEIYCVLNIVSDDSIDKTPPKLKHWPLLCCRDMVIQLVLLDSISSTCCAFNTSS